MSGGRLDGDVVVALLGVVMVAALLSRNNALRGLPFDRKALYAAIWLAIFVGGVVLAGILLK
ncbi:hypothetical protein H7F51_13055 [Novosphingobium flavum]|uniref:Uncharacterized protein n=1 Tax=Novosphingobium flavum TaxID=1778672 RepID=A0A7X1FT19_9SPHN|nr:hypothetical protein [Novosphingobium flavum]MBC2666451.1 hypothetical protein [Novosphingobium flavum]